MNSAARVMVPRVLLAPIEPDRSHVVHTPTVHGQPPELSILYGVQDKRIPNIHSEDVNISDMEPAPK